MTQTVSARESEKVCENIINHCDIQGFPVNEFLNAATEISNLGNVDIELGEFEDERLGTIEFDRFRLGKAYV
jgi:hypothetical protein